MTTPPSEPAPGLSDEKAPTAPSAPPSGPSTQGTETSARPAVSRRWWWLRLLAGLRGLGVVLAVLAAFVLGLWLSGGGEPPQRGDVTSESAKGTIWTCSMHPQIRLPEPGQCPICGMDLIPLGEAGETQEKDRRVSLSPDAIKLAEIRTAEVNRGATTDELRLLGRLEYDETAVRTITSWVGGRIDRLYVSAVGARVGAGQAIAEVYSPEVYAAHQDLILARKQTRKMKDALPVARSAADAALEAARQRLRLLGIKDDTLEGMEKAEAPAQSIQIRSPFGGTVLEQMINQGAYVATGTPLFRIAALGRIWVQLDAYETDLPRIRLKDVVTIQVASFPGEEFEGKVTFIDPVLDPQSRTAQVRIEVPNKKGRLRPGMFAEAVIHVPEGEYPESPLVVPESAVLFTGERSVVFVQVVGAEKPTYEAREVQVGPRAGNVYPVVTGLESGERVVIQGAFALDAELQIQGGNSMMTMPDDLTRGRDGPFTLPAKELARLAPVIEAALSLHVALSKDDLAAADQGFSKLGKAAQATTLSTPPAAVTRWGHLRNDIARGSEHGARAKNLAQARKSYEAVGLALIEVLRRYGNPLDSSVHLAHCPMAFDGKGADWLQSAEHVENPYFGPKMPGCGDILGTASAGARLPRGQGARGAAAPAGHQHQ